MVGTGNRGKKNAAKVTAIACSSLGNWVASALNANRGHRFSAAVG